MVIKLDNVQLTDAYTAATTIQPRRGKWKRLRVLLTGGTAYISVSKQNSNFGPTMIGNYEAEVLFGPGTHNWEDEDIDGVRIRNGQLGNTAARVTAELVSG